MKNPLMIVSKDRARIFKMAGAGLWFALFAVHFDMSWFTPDSLDDGSIPMGEFLINGFGLAIIAVSIVLILQTIGKQEILLIGFEGIEAPRQSSQLIGWSDIEAICEVQHSSENALVVYLRPEFDLKLRFFARLLHKVNSAGEDVGDLMITFANANYPSNEAVNAIANHFPVERMR